MDNSVGAKVKLSVCSTRGSVGASVGAEVVPFDFLGSNSVETSVGASVSSGIGSVEVFVDSFEA